MLFPAAAQSPGCHDGDLCLMSFLVSVIVHVCCSGCWQLPQQSKAASELRDVEGLIVGKAGCSVLLELTAASQQL